MNPNPFVALKNFTVPFMFASDVKPRHVRLVVDPVNRRHFCRILDQWPVLWNDGPRQRIGRPDLSVSSVCDCLAALTLACRQQGLHHVGQSRSQIGAWNKTHLPEPRLWRALL